MQEIAFDSRDLSGEKETKNVICDNVVVYLDETAMLYQKLWAQPQSLRIYGLQIQGIFYEYATKLNFLDPSTL